MRIRFLAAVLAAALAAPAGRAADPPVVFQTQPVGRLLEEARGVAKLIGGDKAAEEFDGGLKGALGEKGFDGLDLARPVAGYVAVPADPARTVAVVALPVTGEEAFVAFVGRVSKEKVPAAVGGVYTVPGSNPGMTGAFRVVDGYAYLAGGAGDVAAKALAADALVPFAKVYDPTDTALASAKVHFGRFPEELRGKAAAALAEAQRGLAALPLPPEFGEMAKEAAGQLGKLGTRSLELAKGAKTAGLKLNLDGATGDLTAELSLAGEPGSPLARDIAARKPTANAFAGLVAPDAAAGVRTRLPLFTDELRAAAAAGLEVARKEVANHPFPPVRSVLDELLQGAVRTAKTGEADVAAAVRGPDADGHFTAVGAVAFDDPSKVEAEFRKAVEQVAPPDAQALFEWDAEKAGKVAIHTFALGRVPEQGRAGFEPAFGGGDAMIAFAFAPKAVVLAMGPGAEAVKAVKGALGLKPGPAPVLDLVYNPAKAAKLMEAIGPGSGDRFARVVGTADKLVPAARLGVAGGAELKVTFGFNLRLLPRGGFAASTADPPAAEVEKK